MIHRWVRWDKYQSMGQLYHNYYDDNNNNNNNNNNNHNNNNDDISIPQSS